MSESDLDDMPADDAAAGGDDVSLDDDLEAMMSDDADAGGEAGGDDADAGGDAGDDDAAAGGGDTSLDDDLAAMMNDDAGEEGGKEGEGMTLDPDLESMLGDEDAGGEAGGAPPPAMVTPKEALEYSRSGLSSTEAVNLDFLLDIGLDVTFEVGRAQMLISDLLTLGQGSVVELHRLVGEELDLFVNGKLIAKGEVVVVNEKFGCRITEIIAPEDRIKHLADF